MRRIILFTVIVLTLASCGGPAARMPDSPTAAASDPTAAAPDPTSGGRILRIYLTGYSFYDNNPPGSSRICCPVLHKIAGGTGTYEDPITVAVPGDPETMEWPAGTRFYLPSIQRYVIVEDNGAHPTPSGMDAHLDAWVGGEGASASAAKASMERITGNVTAELGAPPGRPVVKGPIVGP